MYHIFLNLSLAFSQEHLKDEYIKYSQLIDNNKNIASTLGKNSSIKNTKSDIAKIKKDEENKSINGDDNKASEISSDSTKRRDPRAERSIFEEGRQKIRWF